MKTHIQFQLFGSFAFYYEGQRVNITSQRLQGLLAYLALHPTEPQPRQRLAFLIWPDSSESQAHTNLRTVLHRLQSVLPNVAQLLQIESQTITWQKSVDLQLDVSDFETSIAQAYDAMKSEDNTIASQALENAATIYRGDLLPDFYDEWVLAERERLHSLLLNTLEKLLSILEQSRNYSAAIAYARRFVSLDPLNEVAYLRLMNLHVLNGERASGLRVYHSCASILQTELGVVPGKALNAAYEKLLAIEVVPASKVDGLPLEKPTLLIGRDREWQQVQAVVEVAMAGRPRMLIFAGEAGIGKTRLAEELLRWANRQGMVSATAPCYAAEGDLAFAPITILLRSDGIRANLQRLGSEWLSDISRIAPDLFIGNPNVNPPTPLTEQWQRQRLFEALARAVLSTQRSMILLIDDLQWGSRDTLEWLHFLLRFESKNRLLIVGTLRLEEMETNQALTEMLTLLRTEARLSEITLNPLTIGDTSALAANILGTPLSYEQTNLLFTETEGNPLFVLETLRAEVTNATFMPNREDAARANTSGLPSKVQAVIERRLNQLTPDARRILEVAAVIGRSFTFEVLAQAVEVNENTLIIGLDELWKRRILREQDLDSYDFTHDKIRAIAYVNLRLAQRKIFHRRVAQALETVYQNDLDPKSGQIAAHYEEAGIPTKAAIYYQRAALYARQLYANDVALTQFQNAIRQIASHAQAEQSALYEQMGDLLHLLGRYPEARNAWQNALAGNISIDRVNRAHLYRKLGNAWRDQFHYDEALDTYDAAEAVLSSHDASDDEWLYWAETNLDRATLHYWRSESTPMLALIAQIQPTLEKYGSLAQRARLHQISALAIMKRDRFTVSDEAAEHSHAYLQMIIEANDFSALPAAHFQHSAMLLWTTTRVEEAASEMKLALAFAEKRGDISLQARCLTYLTVAARLQENIELVSSQAQQSLDIALAHKLYDYIGAAYANFAWVAWRTNDYFSVHKHGLQALEEWRQLPIRYGFEWICRLQLIAVALVEDDIVEAHAQATWLLDKSQQRLPVEIDSPLEEAVKAANQDDMESTRSWLEIATKHAANQKYL